MTQAASDGQEKHSPQDGKKPDIKRLAAGEKITPHLQLPSRPSRGDQYALSASGPSHELRSCSECDDWAFLFYAKELGPEAPSSRVPRRQTGLDDLLSAKSPL